MAGEQREGTRYERSLQADQGDSGAADKRKMALILEMVEILYGNRSAKDEIMQKCAVRLEDMKGLMEMTPTPQSTAFFTAAPTAADMNMLVRDVQAIYDQLATVSDRLRRRTALNPKSKL